MRALVTGGAGFVGANLVNRLVKDNYEVIVFDNLSTGKEENINPKAKFFKVDISDNNVFDEKRIRDYSMDDVITEALTNHLQTYILRLGKGKQGVDVRKIGNIHKRVHYVNKSLSSLNFSSWEHIDFQNSDL